MSKNNIEIVTIKKNRILDFSEERNIYLKKSKSEWLFFLDSDEEMNENLVDEINEKIKNPNINGYYVLRKNYFLKNFIGEDKILRLGRKSKGWWKRGVHEVWHIDGKTGQLINPITHNTAGSLFEYINKINLYSQMHARENIKEGKKSGLIKIIIFPVMQFLKSMINGRGTVFSILQSLHSFLSWSVMYQLQKNENKN